MSGDKKQPLVPRLRFPEFRETGEWKNKQLCALGSFFRGVTYTANDVSEDGLLVLRSSNIQDGALILDKDIVFINKSCHDNIKLKIGDIAICMSNGSKALVGKSAEFHGNYRGCLTVGAFCSIFRPSIEFAKFIFQSEKYFKFVSLVIDGGNIKNLKNSDLEGFEHPVPRRQSEQQKIADCLSSLDDLITAENQKLDALKVYKKGLLQQLFPREGKTIPRLRFPEFRKTDGWKNLTLPEVSKINPAKEKKKDNELVSFISMASVSEDGRINNTEIRTYGEVKKGYTAFAEHDVIIAKITPCFENGKAALTRKLKNGIGFGSTEFYVFRAGQQCLPDFLFLQLYCDSIRAAGARSMTGNAGQRRVPVSFFEELSFYLPLIDEQQQIVIFFASLDDLITAQNKKIDALKAHKKGLMQQLFPVLDEAST